MESDTDGEQRSDTIVANEPIVDPPLDGSDALGNAPIGDPRGVVAPNRVIGGVAADIASRLSVDPLWVRIAFVALIAFGGLGVVLYAGLWLVLIIGARPGWAPLRYLGAAALAIAWAVVFNEGSFLLDNAAANVALLAGVAIALWQPRGVPARATSGPFVDHGERPAWTGSSLAMPQRERSVFGRWVLAAALLVAAGGALVDQLNDGRTHPEQWLGAAAAICGLGVLISAFRGRAYWLTVPALALGAAGFLAGHAARAGVAGNTNLGEADYYIGTSYDNLPSSDSVIAGTMRVHIDGAPSDQNHSELRVGIGVIYIRVAWGVTAEVRATLYDGEASIDGVPKASPDGVPVVLRVGSEGEPDIVIDAVVSHGNVRVTTGPSNDSYPTVATTGPFATVLALSDGTTTDIGEGFRMLRDGTVLFPADAPEMGTTDMTGTIITPDGLLSTNLPTEVRAGGTTAITTMDFGGKPVEYLVLPNDMILTPSGLIIDVPAARERLTEDHDLTATTEF